MSELSSTSGTTSVDTLRPTAPTPAASPSGSANIEPITASANDEDIVSAAAETPDPATSPSGSEPDAQTNLLSVDDDQDPLVQAAAAIEDLIPGGEFPPDTSLRIEQDEESGRFIYQSIDNETGEVVRQFPPEDILEVLALFRDPEGVVLDDLV